MDCFKTGGSRISKEDCHKHIALKYKQIKSMNSCGNRNVLDVLIKYAEGYQSNEQGTDFTGVLRRVLSVHDNKTNAKAASQTP
jgi:hypothetical protein